MNEIRIAVAGLGKRGLWWLELLQRIPGYRICGIYDHIPALAAPALQKIAYRDDVRVYTHWDECLNDNRTEAIALCVRSRNQGRMAAEALLAGKHVNHEVPAAHSIEDCWLLVNAAERSGKVYQLAEQMRCADYVQECRNLIREHRFGDISYAEGQYFGHYPDGHYFQNSSTGKMLSLEEAAKDPHAMRTWLHEMPPIHYVVHDLSPLMLMLDDVPALVTGMSTPAMSRGYPQIHQPDFQTAMVQTRKGAIIRLATSFLIPLASDEPHHWWRLIGTRGRASWSERTTGKPVAYFADDQGDTWRKMDWQIERRDRPAEAVGTGHWDLDFYPQIAFRDAVRKEGSPIVGVHEAATIAATAVLAADSIAQGSVPMVVPDFKRQSA